MVGLRKGAIPSIFNTPIDITENLAENYSTITPHLPDLTGQSTLTNEPFRKQLFGEPVSKRICLSSQLSVVSTSFLMT